MERPVIVDVGFDTASGRFETEVWPMGTSPAWRRDADIELLRRRFPGHCPHHLLHNLLQLHYGRHELCTAAPFSVDMCRHGSHAKPVLTHQQIRAYAPAEGALLLLPFGLSCRACDGGAGLVAGCAECEILGDGDFCGGCRRVWLDGHPFPATQVPAAGRQVDLEDWQLAVGLGSPAPPRAGCRVAQDRWSDEGEEWGEEEWTDEEDEEEGSIDAEGWDDAEEGNDAASWGGGAGEWDGAGDDYVHSGRSGRQAGGDTAGGPGAWGAGMWVEGRRGDWAWVVDFAASAAASTGPAASAPGPDVAAVAASAATEAVRAVLAAGAAPIAPAPAGASAAAPGVSERIRILELQLELESLKRRRLA